MTSDAIGQQGQLRVTNLAYDVEAARLLDRISVAVERGQLVGLIGPNGAGKSTLLRAMAGLLRRSGGEVLLEGDDVARLGAREVARRLAYVSQHSPETHGFTSLEVVLTGRYPHLGRMQIEGAADREIALDAMRKTGTERFAARTASSLSGGERQRVFISRGLAQLPRVLLLDEPIASLDVRHQLAVFELLRELTSEGITVIVAVHDLRIAARFCDRLVLLTSGAVIADGAPQKVLTPAHLAAAFGVRAAVYRDPLTAELTVDFHGAAEHTAPPEGGRVHVICGGGTGARLMTMLTHAGFTVSASPLGEGDVDRHAADTLGVEYIPMPSFHPVGESAHRRHLALIAAADCTVLTDVPFGTSNLPNLEAALAAERLLSLEPLGFAGRDHTDGEAAHTFAALQPAGRFATPEDTFAAVAAMFGGECAPRAPVAAAHARLEA